MTMKLTQLKTYWDADDAFAVILLLDELRDVLWTAYGDEIIKLQLEKQNQDDQLDPGFNDEIGF